MGWKRVFFTYFCDFISTNLSIVASKCGINWTQTHTQFHMEKYYLGNEEYQNKTVLQPFKNTLMYKWLTALININSKRWNSRCHIFFLCAYFFLIGIHSMQGSTVTTRHRVTRKRSTKRLKHTGNLFRKNLQLKAVC